MKKLRKISLQEKLNELDRLSNSKLKEIYGGIGDNDSIPPPVTPTVPPITPTPRITINVPPVTSPPPYKFTINPPGGGIVYTF